MSSPARLILGLVAAALGLWLLVVLFVEPGDGAPAQAAGEFSDSRSCQACHAEVYDEWRGSQHSIAFTNPFVRELSNDFNNKDCVDCHAPRPVFETGIGERVLPRSTHLVEGVDCLACHGLPESEGGGVAGTITDPRAACRPVQRLELQRPEHCAGCHNQHQTVTQWEGSSWAGVKDCLDCHMPHREGDPNRGRHHGMPGGNSLDMLQRAVELRAARAAGAVRVEVQNVGAGHSFPTDERSRAADIFWRPWPDAGAEPGPWRHLWRFRSPYRDEVDVPDTLLAADSTWSGVIQDPEAAGPVEVALFYMRKPYFSDPENPDPDGEATLVHRVEVGP